MEMNKEELGLLNLFYELTGHNSETIPFTENIEVITDKLDLPIKNILNIYFSLLEQGDLKNSKDDRLFLTEKGINWLKNQNIRDIPVQSESEALKNNI